MGNATSASASPTDLPQDLDVLQPGRPLHVLLSSIGPTPLPPTAPSISIPPRSPSRPRPTLPLSPDAPFYTALFRDYVIFSQVARPPHIASFRILCIAALSSPLSPPARALSLTLRAAIPLLRDYASSTSPPREVLGALMLSARLLESLSADTHAMCLVLASSSPHDVLSPGDRADVGKSAVWQVITSALDIIARPHAGDALAPSIALAAINAILVSLSGTYLAPAGGEDSLMADIVDRYGRPSAVLVSLLELVVDAAGFRDVSNGALMKSALITPRAGRAFAAASSREQDAGIVASLSKRVSEVMTPGLDASPSFLARLAGGAQGTLLMSPSLLWTSQMVGARSQTGLAPRPSPSQSGAAPPPPSPSLSPSAAASPPGEGAAFETHEQQHQALDRNALSISRVIPRAPTLLGEQALALLALLCAPRERRKEVKEGAPEGNAATADDPARDNPYHFGFCHMHDLPQRTTGDDDAAYSFSRLYESLGAWADDPRGALVLYHLMVGNRRFRIFVLARTDPDVLLLPLLASIYVRAGPSATTAAPADAYIPAIVLLIMSNDRGFCSAIDDICTPQSGLIWLEERSRLSGTDISLSGLILLVCIRCVQQSTLSRRRVMESYLAATCMSVMANVSNSVTSINNLAADRIVALTEFIGKRWRKSSLIARHQRDPSSSPPIVNGKTLLSPRSRSHHTTCPTQSGEYTGLSHHRHSNVVADAENGESKNGEGKGDVEGARDVERNAGKIGSGDDEGDGGKPPPDIAFALCGVEMVEREYEACLADFLGTLLEVITSILRSRSNVSANRHLIYSLLHREALFDLDFVANVSSRSRVIVSRIRAVISFFTRHLEESSFDGTPLVDFAANGHKSHKSSGEEVAKPAAENSAPGISVDRVFNVIDRCARLLPGDLLFTLPEIQFCYCQGSEADEFVLPYAWVLAMRGSPLHWDVAQFPDSRLPIANATFHPPRPPHGHVNRRLARYAS